MTIHISKEFKIGLVVIGSLLGLFFGFNFLKGKNLFSSARAFYASFDRTGGLLTSAAVVSKDLQVGVVDKIYFHPTDTSKVIVKFLIHEKHMAIPEDSRVTIYALDFLGTRGLKIDLGLSKKLAQSGDTLKNASVGLTVTEQLNGTIQPLTERVGHVVESLDSVVLIIRNVFNTKTQESLSKGFQSLEGTLRSLNHASGELDALLSNERERVGRIAQHLESILQNIRNNNAQLTTIFSNVKKITDDVARSNVEQTMQSLEKSARSLERITGDVAEGKGTLGKLAKDDSLYLNLNRSSESLNKLLEDLKANPKRYVHFSVFGRKN